MKCARPTCEYTIQDIDRVWEIHDRSDNVLVACSLYCARVIAATTEFHHASVREARHGYGPDRYALLESATTATRADTERGVGTGTVAHAKPLGKHGDMGYTFRPRRITGKELRPWLEGDNS